MKNRWIYAGAVAAMLAAAPLTARAQDTTTAPAAPMTPAPDATTAAPPAVPTPDATATPAPTPDVTTTTPAPMDSTMGTATGGSMSMGTGTMKSGGMMMSTATPDYTLLSNPRYDYVDLKKAKASGLSDNTIASLFILSDKTGYSFQGLVDKTLRGSTIATQAQEYGVPIATVLDISDTKDKIEAYKAAYEQTGTFAIKNMGMMSSPAPMATTTTMMAPTKDVVATAMSDKRFSTLVKELKKADLVSTLQGTGPFTVFAPTNDAFKKLPKNALKNLEKDPAALKQVLTYHVISGAAVDAATAMAMTSPTSPATVEGQTLQVTTADGKVKINDATVVVADIKASNGIIHAIDTVLMPTDLPAAPSTDTTGGSSTTGSTSTTGTGGSVSTDSTSTSGTSGTVSPGVTGAAGTDSSTTGTAAPGTGTAAPTTTPTAPAGPDSTAPAAGTGTDTTGTTGTATK